MFQIFGFIVSSFALLVISATMLARANDLRWRKGIMWNVRLAGFVLAGVAPFGVIGFEVAANEWPSVYEVLFRVGLMFVFMTTPYLPPFWRWLTGIGLTGDEPFHHADDRRKPLPKDIV